MPFINLTPCDVGCVVASAAGACRALGAIRIATVQAKFLRGNETILYNLRHIQRVSRCCLAHTQSEPIGQNKIGNCKYSSGSNSPPF